MEQSRKEQLSIYYWLKDLFPSFVNIVDEYPTEELTLPTISITINKVQATPFELGGNDLDKRDWAINVFAQNSGQRDDYLALIHRNLETNQVCVYNYDEGFPPNTSPSQVGSLFVERRTSQPLRVYNELVKKKYWWGVEIFRTQFNPI